MNQLIENVLHATQSSNGSFQQDQLHKRGFKEAGRANGSLHYFENNIVLLCQQVMSEFGVKKGISEKDQIRLTQQKTATVEKKNTLKADIERISAQISTQEAKIDSMSTSSHDRQHRLFMVVLFIFLVLNSVYLWMFYGSVFNSAFFNSIGSAVERFAQNGGDMQALDHLLSGVFNANYLWDAGNAIFITVLFSFYFFRFWLSYSCIDSILVCS